MSAQVFALNLDYDAKQVHYIARGFPDNDHMVRILRALAGRFALTSFPFSLSEQRLRFRFSQVPEVTITAAGAAHV